MSRKQGTTSGLFFVLLAVASVGLFVGSARDQSASEVVDRVMLIAGSLLALVALVAGAMWVISSWAHGSMRADTVGDEAVLRIRSGALPEFRSALDAAPGVRPLIARSRPPGRYFVVRAEVGGLGIVHGAGPRSTTGFIPASAIGAIVPGTTKEGIWTLGAIRITVRSGETEAELPFVVWRRGGLLAAEHRTVEAYAQRLAEVVGGSTGPADARAG